MVLLAITSTFENNCWSGASTPAFLLLCFCPRKSSMTCLSSIRIKNLLYSVFTSFPTNYFGSVRTSLIENDGSPFKLILIGTCNWEFLRLSLVLGSRFSNKIINNHSTCIIKCWVANNPKIYDLKPQKSIRIFTTSEVQEFRSCLAGWSGLRSLMRLQARCLLGLQYPCQKCSFTWLSNWCWLLAEDFTFFPHGPPWRATWVSSEHGSWPPPEWVIQETKTETVIPFMTWAHKSNIIISAIFYWIQNSSDPV